MQIVTSLVVSFSQHEMLAQTAPEVVVVFVLIIGRARPLFVKFATLSTLQYKVCYGKIRNAQIEKSTIFNTDSNSTGYGAPITLRLSDDITNWSRVWWRFSIAKFPRVQSYGKIYIKIKRVSMLR